MKKQLISFFLVALIGVSQSAFADYTWSISTRPPTASAAASCTDWISYQNSSGNPNSATFSYVFVSLVAGSGDNVKLCKYQSIRKTTGSVSGSFSDGITRTGTPCDTGKIYNTSTGACDAPVNPCADKVGRASNIATSVPLPGSACINGCSVAYYNNSNPLTTGGRSKYYYDGNYTGNQCTASNPTGYTECNLEQDCTKSDTVPETDTSQECVDGPDTTTADGKPVKVTNCTTIKTTKQDGEENCKWGTVNGNWTCVISPPKSTSNKADTETKTTTNPDGSKDTKTTTTTTETKCTGVNSCTTTTTTTTTNNHTNADGSPGNSNSTCKGTKCPSGSGTGEGEGESEEEGDDDIAGPTKQLLGTASQGFGEAEAEWQTKIDTARQQLDGLIDQYSNLFSGAFDLNMGTGGGGLPCYKIPIVSRFINTTLDFCPAKFEDQLIYLKYILLAAAAILAGFIILRN